MTKSGTPLKSAGKSPLFIIFLGCSFPIVATILDLWRLGLPSFSLASVLAVQTSQPLHWIIDSVPLFLMFSGQIFGRAAKQLTSSSKPTAYIEQQVAERTAKLTKTITELKAEIATSKRTEETLRAGEEFYRNLIENANDGIITISLDGTITSVNRGVELMLGRPREDLVGQHYSTILSASSSAQVEDRIKRFRNAEKLSSVFEAELLHKNGSAILVEARTRPIHDKTGTPIGFQGVCRDVTKRQPMIDKVPTSQPLSQLAESGAEIEASSSPHISAASAFSMLRSSQNVHALHEPVPPNKEPSHFSLSSEGTPALEHPVGYSPLSTRDGVTTPSFGSGLVADEAKSTTSAFQVLSRPTLATPHSPASHFALLSEQKESNIPIPHSDSTTDQDREVSSGSGFTLASEQPALPSSAAQVTLSSAQQKSDEHQVNITFFTKQNAQIDPILNAVVSPSRASNEVFNLDEALNRVDGDKELLSEMAGVFLDEYPRLLAAIHDALSHGNAQTLTYAVHTLKGSVGNFAATGAFEASLRLEKLGRQGNLSQAKVALAELEEQLACLEPILANLKIEVAA